MSSEKMPHPCECSRAFTVRIARLEDYKTFKSVLDRGRHPGFLGRATYRSKVVNGGGTFYEYNGQIVGVALVNPRLSCFLFLNIVPEHRSHGLGAAIVRYLMPNFIRSTIAAVPYAEAQGFTCVGVPKEGKYLQTQILVRASLLDLAGRVSTAFRDRDLRALDEAHARTRARSTSRAEQSRRRAQSRADVEQSRAEHAHEATGAPQTSAEHDESRAEQTSSARSSARSGRARRRVARASPDRL